MSKKCFIIFALTLCFLTFSEIKAQQLLKNDKIPEDLVIKYWKGSGIGSNEFTVKSNGRVFYKSTNLRINHNNAALLGLLDKKSKNKKPKLKDKLSKKQLKELVYEFEKIEFLRFPNRQLNYLDGCTNNFSINPSTTTAITLEINKKSMTVSAEVYCSGTDNSIAGKFEILAKKISEILKTVKATISE
jgi:hypothetical protein